MGRITRCCTKLKLIPTTTSDFIKTGHQIIKPLTLRRAEGTNWSNFLTFSHQIMFRYSGFFLCYVFLWNCRWNLKCKWSASKILRSNEGKYWVTICEICCGQLLGRWDLYHGFMVTFFLKFELWLLRPEFLGWGSFLLFLSQIFAVFTNVL